MSDKDERTKELLALIAEFVPRLIPLLPESRTTFPVDCTKVHGEHLIGLMTNVGGNYGAMAEFIEPHADYLVSFGTLNVLIDCIRQRTQSEQKVGNA